VIGKLLLFIVSVALFVDGFWIMLYATATLQLIGLLFFMVSGAEIAVLAYSLTLRNEDDPELIVGNAT
jgi:hypothetical protein